MGQIEPRFLRIFNRAQLMVAQSLANRPPLGTIVEITKDMKLKKILESISTGHVTMEQVALSQDFV